MKFVTRMKRLPREITDSHRWICASHPGIAKVSPSPPVVLENESVEINLGAQEIPTPATSDFTFAAEAVSKG